MRRSESRSAYANAFAARRPARWFIPPEPPVAGPARSAREWLAGGAGQPSPCALRDERAMAPIAGEQIVAAHPREQHLGAVTSRCLGVEQCVDWSRIGLRLVEMIDHAIEMRDRVWANLEHLEVHAQMLS